MILIGIGGNLPSARFGTCRDTLQAALDALEADAVRTVARSGWYESEPVPRSAQPWFVNAVASVDTRLDPDALLDAMMEVESRFGRVRGAVNAARTVDLDLLDYCGRVITSSKLVLPHPRLHQRRFVLAPLSEIAPEWRHPLLGQTASQLLAVLSGEQLIRRALC